MSEESKIKKWAIRKRSQREVSLVGKVCERCGLSENLERHHPNYLSSDCVILCQECHRKADSQDGTRPKKKTKTCVVCSKVFVPNHSKKHKTCGKFCLSELGRINALKRWGLRGTHGETEP